MATIPVMTLASMGGSSSGTTADRSAWCTDTNSAAGYVWLNARAIKHTMSLGFRDDPRFFAEAIINPVTFENDTWRDVEFLERELVNIEMMADVMPAYASIRSPPPSTFTMFPPSILRPTFRALLISFIGVPVHVSLSSSLQYISNRTSVSTGKK